MQFCQHVVVAVRRWQSLDVVDNRVDLFRGSDTRIASFILWHFVEEAEHKRVAFDVFEAVSGDYWQPWLRLVKFPPRQRGNSEEARFT